MTPASSNVVDSKASNIRPLSAVLPDLVLSGLLVIGELLRVAAAGPEAAQVCPTVHRQSVQKNTCT